MIKNFSVNHITTSIDSPKKRTLHRVQKHERAAGLRLRAARGVLRGFLGVLLSNQAHQ